MSNPIFAMYSARLARQVRIVVFVVHDSNGDTNMTNQEICFSLYRLATSWIHGFLGRGVQIQLPVCVRGEILDLAPEMDHFYTGFVEGNRDAIVE